MKSYTWVSFWEWLYSFHLISKVFGDPKMTLKKKKKSLPEKKVVMLLPLKTTIVTKETYIQFSLCISLRERAQNCEARDKDSRPGPAVSYIIWGESFHSSGAHFLPLQNEGLGQMSSKVSSKIALS